MAHEFFFIAPISPGCPFPYWSNSSTQPCDRLFISDSPGDAAAWRGGALAFSVSLFVLATLEFIGFVQSHVVRARQRGWRTKWSKEWLKLRSFKVRVMQFLVILLAINILRAVDPYGIFGLVPPPVARAAANASTVANACVGLLFDLSMSGVLLQLPLQRRGGLTVLAAVALTILACFEACDGVPGRVGAVCSTAADVSLGVIFSIGGLVAFAQSVPVWRRTAHACVAVHLDPASPVETAAAVTTTGAVIATSSAVIATSSGIALATPSAGRMTRPSIQGLPESRLGRTPTASVVTDGDAATPVFEASGAAALAEGGLAASADRGSSGGGPSGEIGGLSPVSACLPLTPSIIRVRAGSTPGEGGGGRSSAPQSSSPYLLSAPRRAPRNSFAVSEDTPAASDAALGDRSTPLPQQPQQQPEVFSTLRISAGPAAAAAAASRASTAADITSTSQVQRIYSKRLRPIRAVSAEPGGGGGGSGRDAPDRPLPLTARSAAARAVSAEGGAPPPLSGAAAGHSGGRCCGLPGLQLRLLAVSTVFYALQVAVASFALAVVPTEAALGDSLSSVVPLAPPAAVFARSGMLLSFWVVPPIVVLLTTDGHATGLVAVTARRWLRRLQRRWPWLRRRGSVSAAAAAAGSSEERGRRLAGPRSLSASGRSVETV